MWLIVPAITVKSSAATITGRPLDPPRPEHDGLGRRLVATGERAELEERPGVDERVDARPGVELARRTVLGQSFLAAHRAARHPPALEVGQRRIPVGGPGLSHPALR